MKKQLIALALLAVSSCAALAQSACPQIIDGRVLTAAQWNNCFTRKQDALGFVPVNKAGDVMTGKLTAATPSTTASGLNIGQGAAPTTPLNGDVWATASGVFVQLNGVTQQLAPSAGPTITNPTITGGTINNTVIGGTTPAAGSFTALAATGTLTGSQQVLLTGRTDATISADQNDWTPAGTGTYSQSTAVFVDGGVADRNITGITGGAGGRFVWLVNKGTTNNIVLKNASGSSTAANRFLLAADTILPPNTAIELRYDGSASNWRPAARALSNTGVTAGTYGSSTQTSQVTVGADGRVTSASNVAIAVNAGVIKANIQKFTSGGTYTPTTGMLFVITECVGSGGGGGAVTGAVGSIFGGGGGGAGAYSRVKLTAAQIGASQVVTVGTAGTAGSGGNGGNGSVSSLGSLCTANGGAGGIFDNAGSVVGGGGAGGTVGTGDVSIAGSPGGTGGYSNITSVFVFGGKGAEGPWGGAPAVSTATSGTTTAGSAGNGYGAGGGGAIANNVAASAGGGAGSAGVVIVTEYLNQ